MVSQAWGPRASWPRGFLWALSLTEWYKTRLWWLQSHAGHGSLVLLSSKPGH
jgi:hypothetical protein